MKMTVLPMASYAGVVLRRDHVLQGVDLAWSVATSQSWFRALGAVSVSSIQRDRWFRNASGCCRMFRDRRLMAMVCITSTLYSYENCTALAQIVDQL
jgi:hypothetical protein